MGWRGHARQRRLPVQRPGDERNRSEGNRPKEVLQRQAEIRPGNPGGHRKPWRGAEPSGLAVGRLGRGLEKQSPLYSPRA